MKELNENDKKYLLSTIREIKDYPKAGILFRDITTLLNDKKAFEFLMSHLEAKLATSNSSFPTASNPRKNGIPFAKSFHDFKNHISNLRCTYIAHLTEIALDFVWDFTCSLWK